MFQVLMQCDPWDLVQQGIDEVLDRFKGEAGAAGISLTLLSSDTAEVRISAGDVRLFRSEGGACFQPQAAHYAGSRMRPPVVEWLRKSNPLKAIVAACRKRGLALHGRVIACRSPLLVRRFPFATAKTVFGDPHPSRICPINPDVREMMRGVCEELIAAYEPDGIELEEFALPAAGSLEREIEVGTSPGATGSWLLNRCFCESCRQLAARDGIDVAAAAESMGAALRAILTEEQTGADHREWLGGHPEAAAFAAWQARQVEDAAEMLARTCRGKLVQVVPSGQTGGAGDTPNEPPAAVREAGVLMQCSRTDADEVTSAWKAAEAVGCGPDRVAVELKGVSPACDDPAALVRALHEAATLKLRAAVVGPYGLMPPQRLDWIRRAVRYAVREAAT